jgi:hypothetical protein
MRTQCSIHELMRLDELVAALVARQHDRPLESWFGDPAYCNLPDGYLSSTTVAGHKLYKSSTVYWEGEHRETISIRRYSMENYLDITRPGSSQMKQGGPYKNRFTTHRTLLTPRLWWEVASPDVASLERLLSECTHIGKFHNRGLGEVESWQIEDSKELIVRPVPSEYGTPHSIIPPWPRPETWVPAIIAAVPQEDYHDNA